MTGQIELGKIGTGNHLADALTKHVEAEILGKHIKGLGMYLDCGRHVLMPEVAEHKVAFEEHCGDDEQWDDLEVLGSAGLVDHECSIEMLGKEHRGCQWAITDATSK